ncbi:lipid II flippase Amj family protein [candidate division KSB1 bacterium]|nr:lipid II flippase Amj family protein [candidate division KSB1 bacterium]
MDYNLLVVSLLTFIINLVGTLSFSARIAGVRLGKIAISLTIFNILLLVSRLSNTLQAPLIAKKIETDIASLSQGVPTDYFRIILVAGSVASVVGGLLTPTAQRIFSRAISQFSLQRSIPRLLFHSFSKSGIRQFKESLAVPNIDNLAFGKTIRLQGLLPVLIMHTAGTAIWSCAVLASLYAGYLVPELRVTASTLSSIVNGAATIMMAIFVDPYLSLLTDEAVEGKVSDAGFRKIITLFLVTRFLGTLLAQLLLIPSAALIVKVSGLL